MSKQSYMRFIISKLQGLREEIRPQQVVFTEILLEKLFSSDTKLDKNHLNLVFKMLGVRQSMEFFVYSLIWHKSRARMTQSTSSLVLTEGQVRNFTQISQYFFLICAAQESLDFELVFHYLRLCLLIQDKKGESLSSTFLKKQILFQEETFWLELYHFLTGYLSVSSKSQEKSKNSSHENKFFGFLKGKSVEKKYLVQTKAFEEVSSILFRAQLDFEHITNVLI